MNNVTISIEADTEAWAEEKAQMADFASASEYLAHLVQRERDVERLRSMLDVDGVDAVTMVEALRQLEAESKTDI